MKKIDSPLRVCRGAERALVVLQYIKPAGEIGSVILADLLRQIEIGAEESGAEFGREFLAGMRIELKRLLEGHAISAP